MNDFKSLIKQGSSKQAPRILIMGVEGVGKTTAGANLPNPIFLCSEDGLVGADFAETPNYTANGWKETLEFVDWLTTQNYQSLVIDTLDWLEPVAIAHMCERDNQTSIMSYGHGNGYNVLMEEFRLLLTKLTRLNREKGMGVLFLAHAQIKTFSNPTGDDYDRYEMKVSKKVAGLVKEWCNDVLFANFEVITDKKSSGSKAKGFGGQKRIVHSQRSAAWDAKTRSGLPDVMPLDMEYILKKIDLGQPAKPEDIIKEIQSLIKKLPKEDQQATTKFAEDNKNKPRKLAELLNRLRELTDEEEETDNG